MCQHHHHHGHDGHHHHHPPNRTVLLIAFLLTFSFAVLEIVFSFISESLVLFSEGLHMASDGISLFLGLLAVIFGAKAATPSKRFGYKRVETIAAFVNGLTLLLIPVWVLSEAVARLFHPADVDGQTVLWVAGVGLVVNIVVAVFLSLGDTSNVNLRAALLHVMADLFSSVATILTAVSILLWEAYWVDAFTSVIVSVIILKGGWRITKETFHILMEGTPKHFPAEQLETLLQNTDCIMDVTDWKVWSTNGEDLYGTLHIVANNNRTTEEAVRDVRDTLRPLGVQWTIEITKKG